ncbi:MAG: RNA polymerase sigma factor [Isosphaeraceae bacterium]
MATARWSGGTADGLASLFNLGAAGGLSDGQLLERFLARDEPAASEAAFAALLDRHGSLVLAVCRRELADDDEAHDAFQATFLVLASKARTIRKRDSV